MKRSGWLLLPAAFFLALNFSISSVNILFISRTVYFIFLISLFFLIRKFSIEKILRPLVGGISFILFTYGFIQKFILFPIYLRNFTPGDDFYSQALVTRIQTGRIFTLFRMPTLYAIICAILILFILHFLLSSTSSKYKIPWGILIVMGILNLVFTQSFGGLLCFTVGILAYLLLAGILKLKYLSPLIMIFFMVFSIVIGLRYKEAKNMEPVKLRLTNWAQAARTIRSTPFLGVGLGNYESMVSYHTRGGEAKSIYAHNFILQFTAETGIILPVFLVLMLFLFRKKLVPPDFREPSKRIYIAVFCALMVYNLIDIGFYFFSAGLAAVLVLSQVYRPEQVDDKDDKNISPASRLNLVLVIALALLLGIETISDNYRREGDLLLNRQKYRDAEINYRKSFAVNPFNFKSITGYAYLELLNENDDVSAAYLDRVLVLYPDSSFAHFLKSKIQLKKGLVFNAFYHASRAYMKNKLNVRYSRWYHGIKKKLEDSTHTER